MKKTNAILGALLADAAALGLHWLYDQKQIERISQSGSLFFRQPDKAHYENRKGYFAQGGRRSGQLSHYGESARIAARVCASGSYSTERHRDAFMDSFGPCGSFHGYADRPTKALIAAMLTHAEKIIEPSGVDDDQMPALCPVAGVFSNGLPREVALAASRVISTNAQLSVSVGMLYDCMHSIAQGVPMADALRKEANAEQSIMHSLLKEALDWPSYGPLEVAEHFGLACHVPQGMPVSWHVLLHANSFEQAITDNVRCGGDSCGRAMIIGPIAALAFGVPRTLLNRLDISAWFGLGVQTA